MLESEDNLPRLTHMQCLVLSTLGSREMTGKDLRNELAKVGTNKSGPGFYQLMSRLEDSKFIKSRQTQKIIDGQIIKESNYRITGDGLSALEDARSFYSRLWFQNVNTDTPLFA
jgi:DNA-binding PadR family transcriptional regulator